MDSISGRVKDATRRAGLSETKLAKSLGVSQPALNKAINRNNESYHHLDKIAEILEVPLDWLRNGGPAPWDKTPENTNKTDDLEEEIAILKRTIATLGTRYVDLANLCKEKGVDVPSTAIEDVKSLLESL